MGTGVGIPNSSRWTSSWRRNVARALCSRVLTAPGPVQAACHLGVAEPAEVEERDRRPLARRQRRDGAAHALGDARRLGGLLGPRAGRGRLVALGARPPRALLQGAPAQVQADADQPGAEPVVAAQPIQAQQRGHDRLLRGVGGQLGVAGRPPAGGQQQAVVALDQGGERAAITAARGGHEGVVGLVAVGSRHGLRL
jgi:hypothetical protein